MFTLSTKFYSVLAVILILLFSPASHAGLIDGKDWRQLTETINLSREDVLVSGCDATTGVCIGGDHDGWTFASRHDVAQLFAFITGSDAWDLTESATIGEYIWDSTWFHLAFDTDGDGPDLGYFTPTLDREGELGLYGYVNTVTPNFGTYNGVLYNGRIGTTTEYGTASTEGACYGACGADHAGIWMYATISVPAPQTYTLLILALIGLGISSRKRSLTKNAISRSTDSRRL